MDPIIFPNNANGVTFEWLFEDVFDFDLAFQYRCKTNVMLHRANLFSLRMDCFVKMKWL